MMTASDIAALQAAGAGAAVSAGPTGYPQGTPANATIGYARCANPDGTITLAAFLFNGTAVTVTVASE